MRYDVGKTYAFVKVTFINRDTTRWLSPLYMPTSHVLEKIDMRGLKVTAHEKVPSTWGPEEDKQYDGYLMEEVEGDDKGQEWRNQYPTASYGQIDDSSDRLVRRFINSDSYDWDVLDQAAKNKLVELATDHYTDALWVLTQAYKLKYDVAPDYAAMRETMSLSDADDFDKYIATLEREIYRVTGRAVGMREIGYRPLGAPGYEISKGRHEAYYMDGDNEREVIAEPTNYAEFRAYWNCLRTSDDLFDYVRKETARLKEAGYYREGIHVYCGVNLGLRSYMHSIILTEDDLEYRTTLLQTKGAKNPNFVGYVDDVDDPRLAHLTMERNDPHYIVVSKEKLLLKEGDCDGAILQTLSPFFRARYQADGDPVKSAEYRDDFHYATYGLSIEGEDVPASRLLFTSYGMARKFSEWGKNDQESIARIRELDAFCDVMDRIVDDMIDDNRDAVNDDDDLMEDDYREPAWKMPDDIAARGDME
ncbi:hypothetical protein [Rhizobium phage RHph_N46]|nr:hypothetical protein [Rhizobium phage RHph_N46]